MRVTPGDNLGKLARNDGKTSSLKCSMHSLYPRNNPMAPIASRSVVTLALCLLAFTGPVLAEPGPFAGLSGNWSGSGTISMADGSTERVRCRASYRVERSEANLQQSLRCASDSYRFELTSNVTSEGGRISGTWSEASRGINGNLQGKSSGGRFAVAVDAPGFSANLTLTTQGNRQSVTMVSQGEIRNVSISLARG